MRSTGVMGRAKFITDTRAYSHAEIGAGISRRWTKTDGRVTDAVCIR
jgi:hypothetical protein